MEIIIKEEAFRVIRSSSDNNTFSVFNYATYHIIKKNNFGIWKTVEHRFGTDSLPLDEIGEAIDKHYTASQVSVANATGMAQG
jgi:hypothetical protein